MIATDFRYLYAPTSMNVCFALARTVQPPPKYSPREVRPSPLADATLLDWAQHYLPHYFQRKPSRMHRWLSDELGLART